MVINTLGNRRIFLTYSEDAHPKQENFVMHTHNQEEIFIFLGGHGIYHVEGNHYPLIAGDILLMRPGEAHYIEIFPDHPYRRISVNFDNSLIPPTEDAAAMLAAFYDRVAGTENRYHKSEFRPTVYSSFLSKLTDTEECSQIRVLTGVLEMLLEIRYIRKQKGLPDGEPVLPLSHRIIQHINQHLFDELTLDDIAATFFISKATLARLIRNSTGSTPWRYITVKRLYCAKTMLEKGHDPHTVCFNCGFNNYSSFFRAYKRMFAQSPGQAKNKKLHF